MTDFKAGGVPTPDYDTEDINYVSQKTEFTEDVFVYGKLYADLGGDVQTFSTAGVERIRITKEGDVAIGSENPNVEVESSNTSILSVGIVTAREYYGVFKGSIDPSVANDKISEGNSEAEVIDTGSNGHFKVTTEGTERVRIDSAGMDVTGAITADDLRTDNSQTFFLTSANDFRFRNIGGTERLRIDSNGATFNGDINLSGTATATNQNRRIFWTAFDKENVGDVSDTAEIRHTTNVHGITGSVLEIKTENDVVDGIALNASSGNGPIALVGKKIDVSGYIEPSYGAGDNGIKWSGDPSGGSGDIATIQYYQDGSGEDTRLRILIANDADDDLRLEATDIRAEGTFSKSSGSFRIPHVLTGLTTTTDLIHSFVEGPQADNLYRGRTTLVAGISTVNIDTTNNMTDGTFVNLNRDVQCFTTNETGWTAIKGSFTGNLLTIIAQDNTCTDTISWMVIGERWDLAMYDPKNPMTDANGKVKTEIPNDSYNKGGGYEEDYIRENKYRVGISTISRPAIENKEIE